MAKSVMLLFLDNYYNKKTVYNMLSLNPRFDSYVLKFPKDFIPQSVFDKYTAVINRFDKGVMRDALQVLNESVQELDMLGVNESVTAQEQRGRNRFLTVNDIDETAPFTYNSVENPLKFVNMQFSVRFRLDQYLINYFMLYEIWSWYHKKDNFSNWTGELDMKILNDTTGQVMATVKLKDVLISTIDSLSFSYTKTQRDFTNFSVGFVANNVEIV